MESYIFKFSSCLLVFWLVYVLLLERQKMHHLKRFYLLGTIALSLIIPLLTITYYIEPVVYDFEALPAFIPLEPTFIETPIEKAPIIDYATVLWAVYGLGVLLFTARFISNLIGMYSRITQNEKISKKPFLYVLLESYRIPHSFFKYIFLNKAFYNADAIPKEVILHEETHAKQLHSIDIIVLELIQIIFWFHPLIYVLKHHVKLNHEFLADEAVLNNGINSKTYQTILLQFSSSTQNHQLSSAINYSSIKKRFTVMKTQTSKTKIWLSMLLLIPIGAILFYSFAEKEYVEKENTDLVQQVKDQLSEADTLDMVYVDEASKKLMQEYRDFIENFNETNTIWKEKYERAVIIYDGLMSDAQRASVEKYPEDLLPKSNLSKTKPRKPTSSQFEAFKNSKAYAIWIDGKHVSNTVLDNYSVSDFVHFTGSKIYKNARSKKFPQPNQYHLYTKAGFKTTYQDAQLNKYNVAVNRYTNAISEYLKGPQNDNSELQILYVLAHDIYTTFSKEDIKLYNIKLPPGCPPTKSELDRMENTPTLSIKKDGTWWINGKKTSIKTIKEDFNVLVNGKKLPLNLHTDNPISVSEINRIQLAIGDNITAIQVNPKQNTVYDTEENVSKYQVESYSKMHKRYEALRNSKPHYINKSEKLQKEMDALFSDLGGLYFRMSKSTKAKVKRPIAPIFPYVKITLNGKTYFKKSKDLTKAERATLPPPPPPPAKKTQGGPNNADTQDFYNPNFLEYIIEMEQLGASFYLDDKKISAKDAKSIAKDNNSKSTEMMTQKDSDGKYIVKLTSPEKKKIYARSIELQILNDNSYLIDGINATKRTFIDVFNQLHQDITPEVRNNVMNIHVTSSKNISNKETWFIYNSLLDYGFYRIITPNQEINRAKGNTPFAIESQISPQEKPTKKQIAAYNAWAKKINSAMVKAEVSNNNEYPIIKRKDIEKYTRIYSIMSVEQKKKAEAYPDFSKFPPPIAPATGFIEVNGEILFYVHYVPKRFYNKKGYLVDKNGKTINGNTQVNASDILPGQYITRVYQNGKVVVEFKDNQPNRKKMSIDLPLSAPKKNKTLKTLLNNSVEEINSQQQKSGPVEINGATYYFSQNKGRTTYYDRYGKEVDINKIPPPPPIPNDATPEQKVKMKKATDAYMKANPGKVSKIEGENGEVYDVIEVPEDLHGSVDINGETFYYTTGNGKTKYFNRYGKEMKMDNLPPPPPAPPASEATLDFVIRMAKANAKFFYEGKLITSDKAIELLKKNPKLNVNGQKTDTKQPLIYITKKPMLIGVKGKGSKKEKGGPNASHQQAMIDFLRKANNQGAILTQVDAQPSKIPSYYTHLTLDKAISLIKNDSKMKLYPYNSPHSGYIVLISKNIENTIPKLTAQNRFKHITALTVIGAKFYLEDKSISFKEAKRFIKRNPKAEIVSSVNPPYVKINSI